VVPVGEATVALGFETGVSVAARGSAGEPVWPVVEPAEMARPREEMRWQNETGPPESTPWQGPTQPEESTPRQEQTRPQKPTWWQEETRPEEPARPEESPRSREEETRPEVPTRRQEETRQFAPVAVPAPRVEPVISDVAMTAAQPVDPPPAGLAAAPSRDTAKVASTVAARFMIGIGLMLMFVTVLAMFGGAGVGAGIPLAVIGVGLVIGGWLVGEKSQRPPEGA
jgi:hypothetical protein